MKVKIDPKRNLKIFLIAFFVCAVILFLAFMKLFVFTWPWSATQYIIIGVYVALSLVLLFLSFKTNYYIINNNNFEVHRFGKVVVYEYKNIIYIDEKESTRTKTLCFVSNVNKKALYLAFDKNKVIYTSALEKSVNRMNDDDFHRQFPQITF